ncbi:MAG: peptide chain release factor N(5)-glutamine methyltransferase [Candidatus Polarisedimenticolaceae bacterium]|nr:peptide chain release factor N(5)-glutamine methyltransferase [Candidatus Polarisedimenticolaceae bacterium]
MQSNIPDSTPTLEAKLLLSHLLQKDQSYLYAWPEKQLKAAQWSIYQQLIQRRISNEPIAYITGQREFWSLTFRVTPATLIPRPETEQLVELSLHYLHNKTECHILDLGTGSGAIAAAIASERPHWCITATDDSDQALVIAKENFQNLKLNNITRYLGNWYDALPAGSQFDIIISNPPYITHSDPHLQQGDLTCEPLSALASGLDGLDDIRQIIKQAPQHLKQQGRLILEHGYEQGRAVRRLLAEAGLQQVKTHQDLSGLDRISEGIWNLDEA